MNTFSHLLIGKFLCEYVQEQYGIVLDKSSFIWGNISPDFSVFLFSKPHYLKNYTQYLQDEMSRLLDRKQSLEQISPRFSKRLGVLCHFYSDFFCFAHNAYFTGNLNNHIDYEMCLHKFFKRTYDVIKGIKFIPADVESLNVKNIYSEFEKMQTNYLSAKSSCSNDIIFSILACVEVIVLITNCAPVDTGNEVLLGLPSLKVI